MRKIIIAGIAALLAVSLCGCVKTAGENSSIASTAPSSAAENPADTAAADGQQYKLESFTFNSAADFKLLSDSEKMTTSAKFECDKFQNITITESRPLAAPEIIVEESLKVYNNNDSFSDITTGNITAGDLNVYSIHYKYAASDDDVKGVSEYFLITEGMCCAINAAYEEDAAQECIAKLDSVAASIRYTGEKLPTQTQNYRDGYIGLSYSPQWYLAAKGSDLKNETYEGILTYLKAQYVTPDSVDTMHSSLEVKVDIDADNKDIEELYKEAVPAESDKIKVSDPVSISTEIDGHKADGIQYYYTTTSSNGSSSKSRSFCHRRYWLKANGAVYSFGLSTSSTEDGTVREDVWRSLEELLAGISVPELTEEQIQKKLEEYTESLTTDYTWDDLSFTCHSSVEAYENNDDPDTGKFYTNSGGLSIRKMENPDGKSAEDFAEELCGALDDSAEIQSLGNEKYDIRYVRYPSSDDDSVTICTYYITEGDTLWRFDKFINSGEEDDSAELMKQIFDSLEIAQH